MILTSPVIRSRSGLIGFLNVCAFIRDSTKQTAASMSTAEAEYLNLIHCAKYVTRVSLFLAELGMNMDTISTVVF